MLKLVFLDFDGVVLESAGIKTNAFGKLFSDYPEHVEAIMDYERNSGASRFEKFQYIYDNILHLELTDKKKEELSTRLSDLALSELIKCPFVPGLVDFLSNNSKKLKFFVASAAPDDELKFLVKKRGLNEYFSGIYGLSIKKSEIITRVLKNESVDNDESLFVGDALTDYQNAKRSGVPFIGRIRNFNPFPDEVRTIRNIAELDDIIKKLL